MTTYLNSEFGAADYAKFRPTYPETFLKYILDYHKSHSNDAPLNLAVDMACGTGQATIDLAKHAKQVAAFDHSATMVERAKSEVQLNNVHFDVSSDIDLSTKVERASVDLLVVAEAAHYFHWPQFWNEAALALRPGGTLAMFSYFLFAFPDYPEATKVIDDVAFSHDKCGPYWDDGANLLINNYEEVMKSAPTQFFQTFDHRINKYDELRPDEPFELTRTGFPVKALLNIMKTWSPYFNWKRNNPDQPDIVDNAMSKISSLTGLKPDDEVTVKWSTVYILATRSNVPHNS